MKIVVGSDHAGLAYKQAIKEHLEGLGHKIIDVGTYTDASTDYPIYGRKAAQLVASGEAERGILVCATGEGISIAANKVPGVRCGLAYDDETARLIRNHNDANMVAFGSRRMDLVDVLRRVDIFLAASFEGGRHARRVAEIE